jgi:5,10-methylenetetrahydrofolate reductase
MRRISRHSVSSNICGAFTSSSTKLDRVASLPAGGYGVEISPPSSAKRLDRFLGFISKIYRVPESCAPPSFVSIGWRGPPSTVNPFWSTAVTEAVRLCDRLSLPVMVCVCALNMSKLEMTETLELLNSASVKHLLILKGAGQASGPQEFETTAELVDFCSTKRDSAGNFCFSTLAVSAKCASHLRLAAAGAAGAEKTVCIEKELRYLSDKAEKGANMAVTLPVYDVAQFRQLRERHAALWTTEHSRVVGAAQSLSQPLDIAPGVLAAPPLQVLRRVLRQGFLDAGTAEWIQVEFPQVWKLCSAEHSLPSAMSEAQTEDFRQAMNDVIVLPVVRQLLQMRIAPRHLHFLAYDYSSTTVDLLRRVGTLVCLESCTQHSEESSDSRLPP